MKTKINTVFEVLAQLDCPKNNKAIKYFTRKIFNNVYLIHGYELQLFV